MTSAPSRISSRTLRRISSGPSTRPRRAAGVLRPNSGTSTARRYQSSPWPPVWLSMMIEMLHPRARDQAVLDRLLDAEVRAARVADGRDPDPQRRAPGSAAAT